MVHFSRSEKHPRNSQKSHSYVDVAQRINEGIVLMPGVLHPQDVVECWAMPWLTFYICGPALMGDCGPSECPTEAHTRE